MVLMLNLPGGEDECVPGETAAVAVVAIWDFLNIDSTVNHFAASAFFASRLLNGVCKTSAISAST